MIFITVGTQLPFDRLIFSVDEFFADKQRSAVFAQIGPSSKKPQNIESAKFLPPFEAERYFEEADLIIAHAGMGSVLTALKYRKPILVMPRKFSFGEHRNDHQMATAKWLQELSGVFVAWNERELIKLLEKKEQLISGAPISDSAEDRLISFLQETIQNS